MLPNRIALLGFLVLSGLGIWFSFQSKLVQPITLLSHMRQAEARITRIDERVYLRSHENAGYQVEYEITVDGATFAGSSPVDRHPAGPFLVWYMPENPSCNGAEMRGHAIIDLVIFAIPTTVFAVCLLVLLLPLLRHRRAGAHGR